MDWSPIETIASTKSPDVAYRLQYFPNLYKSLYDKAFPIHSSGVFRRSIGPKQPWMTSALFESYKRKIRLYTGFDTVNHSLLINKLEHYGIRGIAKGGLLII